MKLNDPPDSNGGASAPGESPSSNIPGAALAPAAPTPSPSGEGGGEGNRTVQPAHAAWTAQEVTEHFHNLVRTLNFTRELIEHELAALAPRCPDADTFMNGCCALTKETRALNTFLLGLQLKIRLGEPL